MNRQLLRIVGAFLLGFVVLAGGLFYWQVYRGPDLLARTDNPRHHEEKVRESRGRVLDSRGRVLVESVPVGEKLERHYVYPPLVHVTGFDSSRYGNSGVEATLDAELRGLAGRSAWARAWDRLLRRQPPTRDVTLTVDLGLQTAADEALGNRNGAVVLLEARTGRILALASHPFFDPNQLDPTWHDLSTDPHRPFLGRATQGLYAPGSCFMLVTLASALNSGTAALDDVIIEVPDVLQVEGTVIRSARGQSPRLTLLGAFQTSQAVAFGQLGLRLGWTNLRRGIQAFGLDQRVPLEIETAASPLPSQDLLTQADLASTAVGQGRLSVTPLHMALVMSAIANDGELAAPHLVERVSSIGESYSPSSHAPLLDRVMPPAVASLLRNALAWPDGPSGVASLVGQSGITGLGPGVEPHVWFIGLSPFGAPRYAVAVLIENGGADASLARDIAQRVVAALRSQ